MSRITSWTRPSSCCSPPSAAAAPGRGMTLSLSRQPRRSLACAPSGHGSPPCRYRNQLRSAPHRPWRVGRQVPRSAPASRPDRAPSSRRRVDPTGSGQGLSAAAAAASAGPLADEQVRNTGNPSAPAPAAQHRTSRTARKSYTDNTPVGLSRAARPAATHFGRRRTRPLPAVPTGAWSPRKPPPPGTAPDRSVQGRSTQVDAVSSRRRAVSSHSRRRLLGGAEQFPS